MKSTTFLAVASLLAAVATPSHAQWYAGGALGGSRAKLDDGDRSGQFLELGFDDAATSFDKSDAAIRAFGGYRWNRWVAVELGAAQLGRFEATSTVVPAGELKSRARVTSVDASLLLLWPVAERFAVFARGGAFASRTRVSHSGSGSVTVLDGANTSERSSSGLYGAGAMLSLDPHWDLRLDWTRYLRAGDDRLSRPFDIDTWLLGIAYRF